MANVASQPDQLNLSGSYSKSSTLSSGVAVKKYAPKDLTGAVIDLTGYNAASLNVQQPTFLDPDAAVQGLMTIGTADATGITLSLTEAQLTTLLGSMTSSGGSANIVITNGTNQLIAAVGTCRFNLMP